MTPLMDESGGPMKRPNRSDNVVVGHIEIRHDILLYREEEVGLTWVAEADGLNRAAIGETTDEAVRNLIRDLSGQSFHATADTTIADRWEADRA